MSLALLLNGNLASGSMDQTIKIWNKDTGSLMKTLKSHTHEVRSLVVLQNGYLASGDASGNIKIWNV